MEITTGNFRLAHATDGDWRALVDDCIKQLSGASPSANLGFVYVTDKLDETFERIAGRLREATGIDDWVGTIGFGVCVGGREYFDRSAMVVLVGTVPADDYRLMPTLTKPGEVPRNGISDWVTRRHPLLGVVHGDPRNAYLSAIIDSVCDDTNCFLVGGLTASRGQFLQLAGSATEGGLSGALFAEIVFSRPGIGKLIYDMVLMRNFPVVQGAVLVTTALFVLCALMADMLNSILDPRVRANL